MSDRDRDEDDDLKMITINETPNGDTTKQRGKKKKKKPNIRPKALPKKIDTTNESSNKNIKNKKGKPPKSESTIRRRKIKKLKQKLKDISKLKQIYARDKTQLSNQQISKIKDEGNIRFELESIKDSNENKFKYNTKNDNKSFSHARRINNELQFISQQINSYSQELNNYMNTNNIRTIETYIGNIKNSLLTLYSRMTTLINELDSMQYIPLRYSDNPNKPSIYFKNEFMNNQKPFKPKNTKLKKKQNNFNTYRGRNRGISGPSARLANKTSVPILSNEEIEKRALKKRKELKLKTHIFDNYKFFINRFESFGISHLNLLKLMGCDGRINTLTFKKIAGDLLYTYNWNNNELLFDIIQGIVPHSKVYSINLGNYLKTNGTNYRIQSTKILHQQLYNMQCGQWVGNQLEKISLLVHNGWNLDCKQINSNVIGWSQLLWNMNLDQYYARVICFIHDFMNGKINFIDQNGRSLAHFAASIFPVNMAYKLCIEMNKSGYEFHLSDIDGITPVTIFYCNMLKSYKNIVSTKTNKEFKEISAIIIQWTLDSCVISRNLPIEIVNTIVEYGHYSVHDIKIRNWELESLFINKWVYASIHENYWKIMLKSQKRRLNKIKNKQQLQNEKIEKKLKLKNIKKQNRIDREKKRLYLQEKKKKKELKEDKNDDIEMDDKWKDFEIPIEKQKELEEKDLKKLMIKAKKNKKRNARKKRKKQIKEKIKLENEMEMLAKIKKKQLLQQLLNETGISKIVEMKTDSNNYNNKSIMNVNNTNNGIKNDYINNYKMSDDLKIKDNYHENVLWYLNYGKAKRRNNRGRGRGRGGINGQRGRGRGPYNANQYEPSRNMRNKSNVALNRGNRVTFSRPLWIGRYNDQNVNMNHQSTELKEAKEAINDNGDNDNGDNDIEINDWEQTYWE